MNRRNLANELAVDEGDGVFPVESKLTALTDLIRSQSASAKEMKATKHFPMMAVLAGGFRLT
ncbi:MAG: hypothetical protein ABR589_11145 [Chthoniobacterales bacterium]